MQNFHTLWRILVCIRLCLKIYVQNFDESVPLLCQISGSATVSDHFCGPISGPHKPNWVGRDGRVTGLGLNPISRITTSSIEATVFTQTDHDPDLGHKYISTPHLHITTQLRTHKHRKKNHIRTKMTKWGYKSTTEKKFRRKKTGRQAQRKSSNQKQRDYSKKYVNINGSFMW